MKYLLPFVAIGFIFFSCNTGNYDADPTTDNNTPVNPNAGCSLVPVDSICSCVDSMSWFANGQLQFEPVGITAKHDTDNVYNLPVLAIEVDSAWTSGHNGVSFNIFSYHGPGTYQSTGEENATSITMVYNMDGNVGFFANFEDCISAKVIIISDTNNIVTGTFSGVVRESSANDAARIRIMGGKFTARLKN